MKTQFVDGKFRIKFVLQVFFILYWLIFLQNSESYYMPYLIVGICGILSCYINIIKKKKLKKDADTYILLGGATAFSIMVASANYQMFLKIGVPDIAGKLFVALYKWINVGTIFIGGFLAFGNLLNYLFYTLKNYHLTKKDHTKPAIVVFISSFLILSAINLSVLFTVNYPGVLTLDSLASVRQIMSGVYNNHHPYYYTRVIELFMGIGLELFNDMNAAVATYSTFQVIFMAACISFGIMTLYQMGISLKWIFICWLWYAIMPFHIMYSFTMWKDIMFGGFTIVFIVSIFRHLKNIGGYYFINYLLLLIGSFGMCLFRSNGWFAFLLTFFVLNFYLRRIKVRENCNIRFF